jgi:hypothetical protein
MDHAAIAPQKLRFFVPWSPCTVAHMQNFNLIGANAVEDFVAITSHNSDADRGI